jgi:hypothetical protein
MVLLVSFLFALAVVGLAVGVHLGQRRRRQWNTVSRRSITTPRRIAQPTSARNTPRIRRSELESKRYDDTNPIYPSVVQSTWDSPVYVAPSPSPDWDRPSFSGGESGGGGADRSYDTPSCNSGSSSYDSGSSSYDSGSSSCDSGGGGSLD